ncbi:MAG TPA: C-terminal binding protein [Candidatus Dormibacteraeota bacterium]
MQTTDVLDRWRQPAGWRRPGRVALANVPRIDPAEPLQAALLAAGVNVLPSPLYEDGGRVAGAIAGSDAVVSGGAPLGRAFFAELQTTRLLVRPYVGYDDIDVPAATSSGVLVANVPDAITTDVADHAMALILAANREVLRLDAFVRSGGWARTRRRTPEGMVLHRPEVQTLGLVGFGGIARATAALARPFGYRVIAYDPYVLADAHSEHGVEMVSLEDLLRQSDVVSIHVFLSPETHHLIDAEKLALMKPEAWIVNTARGKVIDEPALVAALREQRIAGAALDVMEREPLDPDSPLLQMANVILSPHVAGYSHEGSRRLRERAAEIALQVALGGLPQRHVVVNKDLYDRLAALPELAGVPRP